MSIWTEQLHHFCTKIWKCKSCSHGVCRGSTYFTKIKLEMLQLIVWNKQNWIQCKSKCAAVYTNTRKCPHMKSNAYLFRITLFPKNRYILRGRKIMFYTALFVVYLMSKDLQYYRNRRKLFITKRKSLVKGGV